MHENNFYSDVYKQVFFVNNFTLLYIEIKKERN